jgi:hypothetical protein
MFIGKSAIFYKILVFSGEELLAHPQTAKLEDHPLFVICVFNIFTALSISEGHLLTCNLRMSDAVVTQDPLEWKAHT